MNNSQNDTSSAQIPMSHPKNNISNSQNDTSQALTKWDERYLLLAKEVSTWSKDPSTQVGAITVGSKKEVLSQGFNGFPRGIADTPARYKDRHTKYQLVVHAEMNAIYNATYSGTSLDGATLYVHGLPICSECAKGIIQVGIKKVIVAKCKDLKHWNDSVKLSQAMFIEAGIPLIIKTL